MNTLLALALAMAIGLALTRVAKRLGIPNVTAYLVAGLAVRYFMLLIKSDSFEGLEVITSVALGFIAFSIGSSLSLFFAGITTVLPIYGVAPV